MPTKVELTEGQLDRLNLDRVATAYKDGTLYQWPHRDVFKTLLPPPDLSPALVEFFCHLYNKKAIPGRMAMTASQNSLKMLTNNGMTLSAFFDTSRQWIWLSPLWIFLR